MPKLFVDRKIEINASASKVWDVLTKRVYTDYWAPAFVGEGHPSHLESDWKLGSPVLWKWYTNEVVITGKVTALRLDRLLCFTVLDARNDGWPPAAATSSITYELSERDGKTTLHVSQGDFSIMPDCRKIHRRFDQAWYRILPRIKQLAEG